MAQEDTVSSPQHQTLATKNVYQILPSYTHHVGQDTKGCTVTS